MFVSISTIKTVIPGLLFLQAMNMTTACRALFD